MPTPVPLTLEGAALPPALRELPEPPVRIFTHGTLPRGPCVAVVGTRDPTPEAAAFARQFAFDLARRGVAVMSGGAAGIDAAAHRGALDAGGVTVVVAPSSLEHAYPEQHAALFEEVVASGGAHVSPFATGMVARRHQFFLRNGVLVALSHALVIIEMPLRSGARNAARWARRLGRACFVVPSAPWNSRGLGGLQELERGARPAASVGPVLRHLEQRRLHAIALAMPAPAPVPPPSGLEAAGLPASRPLPNPARRAPAAGGAGDGIEPAILEAIDAGVRYPGQLAQALSFSIGEVSHAVLLLTLRGLVQNEAGRLTRVR
jgi:DNA processing protein